ncbi:hypothetical protein C8R44DRAFT_726599 [Mycena epipterygia]|nr:hypothetical protein C8R44DRAFT_726599 [Mycena epipterygia]
MAENSASYWKSQFREENQKRAREGDRSMVKVRGLEADGHPEFAAHGAPLLFSGAPFAALLMRGSSPSPGSRLNSSRFICVRKEFQPIQARASSAATASAYYPSPQYTGTCAQEYSGLARLSFFATNCFEMRTRFTEVPDLRLPEVHYVFTFVLHWLSKQHPHSSFPFPLFSASSPNPAFLDLSRASVSLRPTPTKSSMNAHYLRRTPSHPHSSQLAHGGAIYRCPAASRAGCTMVSVLMAVEHAAANGPVPVGGRTPSHGTLKLGMTRRNHSVHEVIRRWKEGSVGWSPLSVRGGAYFLLFQLVRATYSRSNYYAAVDFEHHEPRQNRP